jgi:hypothetical protein
MNLFTFVAVVIIAIFGSTAVMEYFNHEDRAACIAAKGSWDNYHKTCEFPKNDNR